MTIDLIPVELRSRRQWVVWRPVIAGDKVTKPPYNPKNPTMLADVSDPNTWGSYDDAVSAMQENPSLVTGIGFVFTEQDEFFGIDIDDEEKVAPEFLNERRAIVDYILNQTTSYAELSPSGKGIHVIAKGRLPIAGTRSQQVQVECYGAKRYFTMTGNVFNNRSQIVEEPEMIERFFQNFKPEPQTANLGDIEINRRLDLTDEEVIREATNFHPTFAARFNAQMGCQPGEWSNTFMAIVGILDQITGKVDQLERIVLNSPMVLQAPASAAGETRLNKAKRNFSHVLGKVRGNNSVHLDRVAHGKAIYAAIQAKREEDARKHAEAILKQAENAFSGNSIQLLQAFPLDAKYLTLNPPPGLAGEFVKATMAATFHPFLKFSTPATLATLSGILGRSYKLPGGSGLNLNFILAAGPSTGKTQTMSAWEAFLGRAARSIENTITGPSRSRIIKASASSIQGIFEDFMETPAAAWFISECHSQLAKMSDPKSVVDSQLRDAYNDLYDASKTFQIFAPPKSVANRKSNLTAIYNLNISTYWTTTTSKFDLFTGDAEDGFLSRVTIIRHSGKAGDIIPPWEVRPQLEGDLHDALRAMLSAAKKFDETWEISRDEGLKLITSISTEAIEAKSWAFQQIAERIKGASLDGTLPSGYHAVSRLPMNALRIAGLLAVLDSPYAPSIREEHYDWAFGYLLQNLASILSDMDTGELGASMSKDVEVAIREFKKLMRKEKTAGIQIGKITRWLKQRKPFCDTINPGQAVKNTLQEMIATDLLVETQQQTERPGRPAKMLSPTDDPAWTN